MLGTAKNVRNRGVPDLAAWLRTDCDDDPATTYRHVSLCRLYLGRAMLSFLSVLAELALPRVPEIVRLFQNINGHVLYRLVNRCAG